MAASDITTHLDIFSDLLDKANHFPLTLAHTDEFGHVLQSLRDKLHRDDLAWRLFSKSRQPISTWHLQEGSPTGKEKPFLLVTNPGCCLLKSFLAQSKVEKLEDLEGVKKVLNVDREDTACRYL
jgi:hypothetical protein